MSGVQFVSVHDSYWTHAATVDAMARHCREQFVHLHSQPLLDNLYQFFRLHYDGRPYTDVRRHRAQTVCIAQPPSRGSFDVRQVTSTYVWW